MSLASDLLEKMKRKGQIKIKPEPLPSEKPVEPAKDQSVEKEKRDQPETGGPGPLFGESIDGDLPAAPAEGRAKRTKMAPVKIFSKLFDEEIWLVSDPEEMEALVSKGVKEAIYVVGEIPALEGRDPESLRAVHETKKVFPGSVTV